MINIFCKDKLWTGIRLFGPIIIHSPIRYPKQLIVFCTQGNSWISGWVCNLFFLFHVPILGRPSSQWEDKKRNKTNDYDSKETVHLTVSKSKDKLPKQMMYLLSETKSLNFPLRPDLFKVLVKIFRTFFGIFERYSPP